MAKDYNNFLIKKEPETIDVYYFKGGFIIDAVQEGDFTMYYLYHKDYGIKDLMFGLPDNNDSAPKEDIFLSNVPEYVKLYCDQYMDKDYDDIIGNDYSNFLIKKEPKTIDIYYFKGGFIVEADQSNGVTHYYLYCEHNGIKSLMFGLPDDNDFAPKEQVLFGNLPEYLKMYCEEYMDKDWDDIEF